MKIYKVLTLLFFLFLTNLSHAGNEGGGGNLYIRNFVAVALETIAEIEKNTQESYSIELKKSLEEVSSHDNIQLVNELINPDGTVVSKKNLYAFSWPGKIQLLDIVWINWLATVEEARQHKVDIIHELFRAVDSKMDDGYSITLVELGLGLTKYGQVITPEEKQNNIKLTHLLYSGLAAISGILDGTEGSLGRILLPENLTVRLGQNITRSAQSGIIASGDKSLMPFKQSCDGALGWENKGNCFKNGLNKISNSSFVSMTLAKKIVREMCSHTQMFADGARCLKASIPLINDPVLQDIVAGCEYVHGGESITNCYLAALKDDSEAKSSLLVEIPKQKSTQFEAQESGYWSTDHENYCDEGKRKAQSSALRNCLVEGYSKDQCVEVETSLVRKVPYSWYKEHFKYGTTGYCTYYSLYRVSL